MNTTIKISRSQRGSALLLVAFFVVVAMIGSIFFFKKAFLSLGVADIAMDQADSQYAMETAHAFAKSRVTTAITGIQLADKLTFANHNLSDETFNSLVNTYSGNELQFLQDAVKTEAMNGSGTVDSTNVFGNWLSAFPTSYTDPNPGSNNNYQIQYTFSASPLQQQTSPIAQITLEYEYLIQVRSFGRTKYLISKSEDAGVIKILMQGAPFSQWALFRSQTGNNSGSALYFAGGDTNAQIQDVFRGPVATNQAPNFYGHPVFWDTITSGATIPTWTQITGTGYSGAAQFKNGSFGGASNSVTLPTQIFNVERLAAGDTSTNAATNNNTVTQANLVTFLNHYAGGDMASGATSVPAGIYVPIDSQTGLNPTGGIFVEGDAQIVMDVVHGSGDFSGTLATAQYGKISTSDQGCKFQKFSITSLSTGVHPQTIYIAADPCNKTYVFDANSSSNNPTILNSRINGNVHVDGKIDQLGGASRTHPAVAKDFGITISALKDVQLYNDLQYEDVTYVTTDASGNLGTTIVANAYGTVSSSGYDPTSRYIAGQIDSASKTVLGIVSTSKSVLIHGSAPANINLDASIYAGSAAYYNSTTDVGCGSSSYPGCGFGVVGWNTVTNRGAIKLFGGISEYRSQTIGNLSTGTGYTRQYGYDTRLKQSIMPPAFVISNRLQAYPVIIPISTWKITKADQ